jgi:CheY-like chemotaxis protein
MRLVVKSMICSNPAYQLHEAVNGAEALTLAHQERPELVLLDVEMPEMTGPEVCALLKGCPDTHDIPILLMSGAQPREVHGHGVTGRSDGFLGQAAHGRGPDEAHERTARRVVRGLSVVASVQAACGPVAGLARCSQGQPSPRQPSVTAWGLNPCYAGC